MKTSATLLFIFLLGLLLWSGCSKETIEPVFTGSIRGKVQNSQTGEGIAFASVTTNPGTDAILTDAEGQFAFEDIPTGSYTVQAQKEDFETKTVRVSVEEDRVATAQILLSSGNEPPSEIINAEVTNFFNTSSSDSMFVEVDFMVKNISTDTPVENFEVYFKIHTTGESFFQEIKGDSLDTGEQTIGSFTKYIRQFTADSVTISGIYAPDS